VIRKRASKLANDNIFYLSIVFGDEIPIAQFRIDMLEAVDGIPNDLEERFVFSRSDTCQIVIKIIERKWKVI